MNEMREGKCCGVVIPMKESSDRDLMTHQASPVPGTTDYTYDERGELVTQCHPA